MRRKLAILGVVAIVTTLLAMAPASATDSADVDVTVLSNGALRIIGDDGDNNILVRRTAIGVWEVTIFDFDFNELKKVTVEGVTTDVFVLAKGGDDTIRVEDALAGDPPTVRSLHVFAGGGTNVARIVGITAENAITGRVDVGELQIQDSSAGFLIIRNNRGKVEVESSSSRRVTDINTGNGPSDVVIQNSEFGRTQIKGGNQQDIVVIANTDVGNLPSVNTLGGDDLLLMLGISGTRRLAVRTGAGDDLTGIFRTPLAAEEVTELVSLNVNNGAGDDLTSIFGPVGPGDLLNGGSGSGDDLSLCSSDLGATIRLFETVGVTGCDD